MTIAAIIAMAVAIATIMTSATIITIAITASIIITFFGNANCRLSVSAKVAAAAAVRARCERKERGPSADVASRPQLRTGDASLPQLLFATTTFLRIRNCCHNPPANPQLRFAGAHAHGLFAVSNFILRLQPTAL